MTDSDNSWELAAYNSRFDADRVNRYVAQPGFVADDDAGWQLASMAGGPGFRNCACGSRRHWAVCTGLPEEGNRYCG